MNRSNRFLRAFSKRAGVWASAVVLSLSGAPVWAGYTYTDLGTLGGAYSSGIAINNSGQVAGYSGYRATLWDGATVTELGALGGTRSGAGAINNAGQVVGMSGLSGDVASHAVLWNGTSATDLGSLGGTISWASDINNSGSIVGSSLKLGSAWAQAVRWDGTTATELGSLGGFGSQATSINDVGQIVGSSYVPNGGSHAVLWNGTTPTDLGTFGGEYSFANAINNAGQIAGDSYFAGNDKYHATMWDGATGRATDLGVLGGFFVSSGSAINSLGQVVGYSSTFWEKDWINGTVHATLWDGGTVTDLNSFLGAATISAGWVLVEANGINDKGWVTGTAYNTLTGASHAYLLSVSAVPEPESYSLMVAGLGVLGVVVRRKRQLNAAR